MEKAESFNLRNVDTCSQCIHGKYTEFDYLYDCTKLGITVTNTQVCDCFNEYSNEDM